MGPEPVQAVSQPVHIQYERKIAVSGTNTQYLNRQKMVYKLLFDQPFNKIIIDEIQKIMDAKICNQGIINHI